METIVAMQNIHSHGTLNHGVVVTALNGGIRRLLVPVARLSLTTIIMPRKKKTTYTVDRIARNRAAVEAAVLSRKTRHQPTGELFQLFLSCYLSGLHTLVPFLALYRLRIHHLCLEFRLWNELHSVAFSGLSSHFCTPLANGSSSSCEMSTVPTPVPVTESPRSRWIHFLDFEMFVCVCGCMCVCARFFLRFPEPASERASVAFHRSCSSPFVLLRP